jgi:hypothetical protein
MNGIKIKVSAFSIFTAVFLLLHIFTGFLPAQTPTPVSGTISNATWTKSNSPYEVIGNITVQSLTIEPGVEVRFQNNYQFKITGRLTAVGSKKDSIRFVRSPGNASGWHGLLFASGSASSTMTYCIIEDANSYGVRFESSITRFEKCRITNNNASGIEIVSTPVNIKKCLISSNTAHGVAVSAGGKASLFNCIMSGNANNGIDIDTGTVRLTNSLVKVNGQGGIFLLNASDTLIMTNSNVVYNNSVPGIFSLSNHLDIKNSIIFYNGSSITPANGSVTYSAIEGGYAGTGNINSDPLFADTSLFLLSINSPCVDGGNPAALYNDKCFPPSKGSSRNDMGMNGGAAACGWFDPLFIAPDTLLFGQITLGDTLELPVTIKNYSDSLLTITQVQISGGGASQFGQTQTVPITLLPFDSIEVSIRFAPQQVGVFSAILVITSLYDSQQVPLSGSGVIPDIFVTPSSLNFNQVAVGDSVLSYVRVINVGQGTLKIHDLTSSNPVFSYRFFNLPAFILPALTDTLYILFKPDTTFTYSEQIFIHSNDPDEAQFNINLNGTGLAPVLSTSVDSLKFASVLVHHDSMAAVVLNNTGNDTLHIYSHEISGADSLCFQIINGQAEILLPPAARDTVWLQFQPQRTGLHTALFSIVSNDPFNNPHHVVLQGLGVIPKLLASTDGLNFGQVQVNTDSVLRLTISNTGSAPLQIKNIEIIPDSTAFAITAGAQDFILPPSETADTIQVSFSPLTTGNVSAMLQMLSNDPDHDTLQIPLTGRGVNFELAVTPDDSLNFGQVAVGEENVLNVLLENLGSGDLQLKLHLSGVDSAQFKLDSSDTSFIIPENLPQHQVQVRFMPVNRGTKKGVLEIFSNDTDHPSTLLKLSGKGLAAELYTVQNHIGFDSTYVWENDIQSFSLFDHGELNLIIDSIRISGFHANEFMLLSPAPPWTITTSPDSQVLRLQFNPLDPGDRTAQLKIYSNDPASPTQLNLNAYALLDSTPAIIALDTSGLNFTSGSSTTLRAVLKDKESIIQKAFLFVRTGGKKIFQPINLNHDNDTSWSVVIPAQQITERGMQYYLEVGHGGMTTFYPPKGEFAPAAGIVRVPALVYPYSTLSNKYQMISLPMQTGNQNLSDLFQDDLGAYDSTRYRFFDWDNDSAAYTELSTLSSPLPPGKALWLITRDVHVLSIENAQSTLDTANYALPVKKGWNMIGVPYAFPVSWEQIDRSNIQGYTLWYYADNKWKIDSILVPFRGYAVQAITDTVLYIPAQEADNLTVPKCIKPVEWYIRIVAQKGDYCDSYNYAGVRLNAQNGLDIYDIGEPPLIGNFVSLYMQSDSSTTLRARLAGDFREPDQDPYFFNLKLNTNFSGQTRIQFLPYQLPENFDWIILSTHSRVRYPKEMITTDKLQESFQLVIGTKTVLQPILDEYREIPVCFHINQNFPNPFNPSTTIIYQLPQASEISIEIFDILGRKVRSLLPKTRQDAGYYQLSWDGKNDRREAVASAVYILFLQSERYQHAIKMVLQR